MKAAIKIVCSVMLLGLMQGGVAQDTDENESEENPPIRSEQVGSDPSLSDEDDDFVPSEKIYVDSEISFPVDI